MAINKIKVKSLAATGTKDTTTFLRGDDSFQVVDTDLVSDTTPQLGGNLDVNSRSIVSTSNGNIVMTPDGSGEVQAGGTRGLKLPAGTTAQRPTSQGHIRFNSDLDTVEFYDGTDYLNLDVSPTISAISPTERSPAQISAGGNLTITGTNFKSGTTVDFIHTNGTVTASATVTRDSATQLTAAIPTSLPTAQSPFDIKVSRPSGLSATSLNSFTINSPPVFSIAAGSLATIFDSGRSGVNIDLGITDPESGTVTSRVVAGAIPTGLTYNANGTITGTASAVGTDTTSTFTVEASDSSSSLATRIYSITVKAPVVTSITSTGSGNFTKPAGLATIAKILVVGGGAGGGHHGGGGGGAGGLVEISNFSITPYSSPIPYSVGAKGAGSASGSNSTFGGITADGGGAGGDFNQKGTAGGSGGGTGKDANQPGASANQSANTNDGYNTYPSTGYGNGGGYGAPPGGGGGGGGGAGGAGQAGGGGEYAGNGGQGASSTVSGTSVTYAGGGGGGTNGGHQGEAAPGGGGAGGAQAGTDGLGGGGGGANYSGGTGAAGGNGVIIYTY